jgi:anaerobic dimethyl sulfoxide reductase subunit B (iron-sulfur subunit)
MTPPVSQIGFFVDASKCINCKTCEIACKDFHDSPPGRRFRRVRSFEVGEFPAVFAYNLSMSCNHCEEPACVGCPAGAYTKRIEDGIVLHDPEKCIGCRYCTWLCPYGAPQYDAREGRVRKCNLCFGETTPACVAACPMRAIEVALLADIVALPGATLALRDLPAAELTRPSIRYRVRNEARA